MRRPCLTTEPEAAAGRRFPQATALLPVLAITAAAAFRAPDLDLRPMHADESVQAAIFRKLWLEGDYAYDPREFHGPTLPYATLPSAWLSGAGSFAETTEAAYRAVPVAFGVGAVLLIGFFHGGLGRLAALSAALLAAISPAMVFYSRYYIHETLLVFFTLGGAVRVALHSHRQARLVPGGRRVRRPYAGHERDGRAQLFRRRGGERPQQPRGAHLRGGATRRAGGSQVAAPGPRDRRGGARGRRAVLFVLRQSAGPARRRARLSALAGAGGRRLATRQCVAFLPPSPRLVAIGSRAGLVGRADPRPGRRRPGRGVAPAACRAARASRWSAGSPSTRSS